MAVITSSVANITLCSSLDNFSVADTSLFVAKIAFVMADITITVAVSTSSVAKISFVVVEITFKLADLISGQDHFCSGLNIFFKWL